MRETRKILFWLLIGLLAGLPAQALQTLRANLGGKPVILQFDPKAKETIRILDARSHEICRGVSKTLNPWKVQVADADGDGKEDVAVGVYKKARFHPVMANRLFIYGWDGKGLYPKWLGSRLARPFTDFVFLNHKLVAIEVTRDGMNELAVYHWDGFGFTGEWAGVKSPKLSGLTADHSHIVVHSGNRQIRFVFKGYQLQEVRK